MADVITNTGKLAVIKKIAGLDSVDDFKYIAIGSDGTDATALDTDLGSEFEDSGLERMEATITTDAGNVLIFTGLWEASGSGSIKECGIFNDASAGDLLARSNFETIPVEEDDSVQITYKITLT